ncbi:MAG: hypothetical protein Q7R40_12995 [Phaeospirillum sp.]|nr:hypothetical protein [Phaeospirillum sp.]
MDSSRQPDVFIVNELSLIRLVYGLLRGRPVRILGVAALLAPLQGRLQHLVDRLIATGRARRMVDELPELKAASEYVTLIYAGDIYRKLEVWQARHFDYDGADRADPDHAAAYKLTSGKYFHWKYVLIHLLEATRRRYPQRRVFGASADLLALTEAYFGPAAAAGISAQWMPRRLINLGVAILSTLVAAAWTLSRVRRRWDVREVFLAADFLNDPRDKYLFDEVADGGEILIIPRNAEIERTLLPDMRGYSRCLLRQGFFDPKGAAQALAELIRDGVGLYRRHGGRDPELYYHISTFSFRRMNYRALFNRYRPKFFWGRDDYQVESLLRRSELHRVGAKSLGISHAVQGICILMAMWRWISFDIYYVWADVIRRHYQDSWAKDMAVRVVGSFGFSRQQLLSGRRPEKSILLMCRYVVGEPEMIRLVRETAEAFPDYEIWVQAKAGYAHDRLVPDYIAACRQSLSNVHHATGDVYQLVLRAGYVVTDASSVISECLQVGVPTLMFDAIADHETCLYREFPGLCITNADDMLAALKRLIRDGEPYPIEAYADLYNASGRLIYDIIREDLGLPAKDRV